MLSTELTLIRAASVIFEYSGSKLKSVAYWPEFVTLPKLAFSNAALQNEDIAANRSLQRLKAEITLAMEVIERFSPEFCFLDGSIVLQRADKPRNGSVIRPFYRELVSLYEKLYKLCKQKKCILIGCVEDSKGMHFIKLLSGYDSSFADIKLYDTVLLQHALREGYRTKEFCYASEPKGHPVLRDFDEELAKLIKVFYLRASEIDVPLRIEFLAYDFVDVAKLASVVYILSSMNRAYSYPSVLIEADLRARLKPEEIELVHEKLFAKLQSKAMLLRRERRPF